MVSFLQMVAIFSIIVSTRQQNDLHAFKINSSDILFHSSYSGLKGTNIWIGSCICFVFSNAPNSIIKGVMVSA